MSLFRKSKKSIKVMKTLLFSLIVFFTFQHSKAYDIAQIRKDYIAAVNDSDKADDLYHELAAIKNPDALILAYLGSAQAIKAKHSWNPISKVSYLKKGFNIINKAVKKDPDQLEVRFLRFSLQYYVPSFLGFSEHLEADKNKIIDLLRTHDAAALHLDKSILKNMANFMIDSKTCSQQEMIVLKKYIA